MMSTPNLETVVECLEFRPMKKNSLLGFSEFAIKIQGINGHVTLKIKDCPLHESEGAKWVNFPSRSYEKEGKTQYVNFVQFASKDQREAFSQAAITAILKRYPDAFKEVA